MKTTILLLLLPIASIAQPCFSNNPVNIQTQFGFDWGFPPVCDYPLAFMDDPLPCHGAFNRRPQFIAFNTPDTTWTFTLNTLDSPIETLVWSIWNGCPFQGGQLVASLECGGWDCIDWYPIGFTATLTLPAGQYWFWSGLYSDGNTCQGGVIHGVMTMGGECEIEPEPELIPCPQYTVTVPGDTFTYCGEASAPEINIEEIPCGQFDMFTTVQFTAEGGVYPIEIISDMNYVDFPFTPINQPDVIILDGCDGNLVATSHQMACAFGAYCGEDSGQTAYTAAFCLNPGTYIAIIGYMNPTDLPFDTYFAQQGCVSYTFGAPLLLDLPNEDSSNEDSSPNVDSSNEDSSPIYPRYTKVIIEGRGVFIRDGYTGELFDVRTKRVME